MTPAFAMGGLRASMPMRKSFDAGIIQWRPYSWQIWTSFFCLWLFYSLSLYITSSLSRRLGQKSSQHEEEDFTLFQCIWYFSIVPCHFGVEKNVKSVSGKILQYFWSMFLLIFLATYTAFLAAAFSEKDYIKPILSIEDIPSSNYNLCTYDHMEDQISDKRHRNPILTRMLNDGRINFSLESTEYEKKFAEDAERVYNDGCMYLGDDNLYSWLQDRIPSKKLYKIEGYFSRDNYAFAMKENWTYAPNVTEIFNGYGKSGYFDYIYRKHASGKLSGSAEQQGVKKIEMDDVYPIFTSTFGAALVSIIVSVTNYFIQVRKNIQTSN